MNTVDVLLFEKLDVYRRLTMTFEDAEERFWRQLGKTVGTIVKEVVEPTLEETFSRADFWDGDLGCAYRKEWVLDFGSAGEDSKEWERSPSFWFPSSGDEYKTFALMGLEAEVIVYAAIWGQPLSRYTGDLASAKKLWDNVIAGPLKAKGWEPYGQRVIVPTGEWGIHIPIRLDHHDIAKAMESGDLRSALIPLERAAEDFASVCTAMDDVVKNLRAVKRAAKRKI
jgi:hypothetical protein